MTQTAASTPAVLPLDSLDETTQRLVKQVSTTKCPLFITSDGEAAVVVLEARQYEELQRRLVLLERIVQGERDLAEGRTHTQEEVEALLDEWLGDGE
jgi:prevent-host-death family protein